MRHAGRPPPGTSPGPGPGPEDGRGEGGRRAKLLGAGVYRSRPLAPLGPAVREALGDPSREAARDGLDLSPVWARPGLHGRLVAVLADHASGHGAGRILASDEASLALAAPVALWLGVPLATTAGRAAPAGSYLVACVLHDRTLRRAEGGGGAADLPGGDSGLAGVGAVVRVGGEEPTGADDHNILSVIEL